MSSPESPPPEPAHEHEPLPYYQAARFAGDEPAGVAYFQAQEALRIAAAAELSVFRLRLNQVWHVAAVGVQPPDELAQTLSDILAVGQPALLPTEIVTMLNERRKQATRIAPWVERHSRQLPSDETL